MKTLALTTMISLAISGCQSGQGRLNSPRSHSEPQPPVEKPNDVGARPPESVDAPAEFSRKHMAVQPEARDPFANWTDDHKVKAKEGVDDLLRQGKLRFIDLEKGEVGIRERFWRLLPKDNQLEFSQILSIYFQLQEKPGELRLRFFDDDGQELPRRVTYSPKSDRLTIGS